MIDSITNYMSVMALLIEVVLFGRMMEIYMYISVAPIPFSTLINKEWGMIGTNYIKDILYIFKMYEDVNYYIEILLGNYDFLDLEDMSEQELLRLELKELVEAKRKEKMAPMM